MNILPSSPRHFSPKHPKFGVSGGLVCVHPHLPVYVKPKMRVTGKARLLKVSDASIKHSISQPAGRPEFEAVAGHEFAALDLFFGHGRLLNDFIYFTHPARNSFIEYARQEDGRDMRLASWPGMEHAKFATHAHLITCHLNKMPFEYWDVGQVIQFDFYIVDVYERLEDGTFEALAEGHHEFCSMKCPWIIKSAHLQYFEKHRPDLCIK